MTPEPDKPTDSHLYGFRIGREHSAMLDELAKRSGRSRSGAIRRLIELAYERHSKRDNTSPERKFRERA